ncbi:hypothetical protein COCSADRAFT_33530 [Bipolaris sorokiniana ND90Pr]|uniref:Uncharacterized protein n=1 Tax=Cochliobolus sativus (strain ND90Pr / ATCC 201652) TaxID=665912 RepID=M2T2F4_COCSN|nr:uncharacterized protein COCSADRAFT_33530 [Bipolaris sorokiniana ND90Pr]EMD68655.1 hypothetical protein COCSADRAFT_33530 [Bipolaris sorokiniana ND90Pr]
MPAQLAHPSPKRKRDQPAPIPLLNTALALRPAPKPCPRDTSAPSSGGDSPRNTVADQLGDMTLTALAAIPLSPLTPTDDVLRKRPKLDATRVDSIVGPSTESVQETPTKYNKNNRDAFDIGTGMPVAESSRVIPETPQSSQPRLLPDIASFAQPTIFASPPASKPVQPHKSAEHELHAQHGSPSRSCPRKRSPTPPPSTLTWQDSEITGHLVDPSTDPDDDGTGINGIGFKPTPALAYARSQKRRQQLNEWKLRETREARARRSERRLRGVRATPSRENTVEREVMSMKKVETRRTVKFAI